MLPNAPQPQFSRPNPLELPPFDPSEPYVFVSYSRIDIEFVRRFTRDLQSGGINVWIDQIGLTAGTPNWDRALREAVRGSIAFLLIASPASRESNYVADEITLARMYTRPIYPIWALGEQFIDSIPMGMGRTQYIDARGEAAYVTAITVAVEAVRGVKPELRVPEIAPLKKDTLKPYQIANPYKGLEAFRAADRELFFGRTTLVGEMVKALQTFPRFMSVLGASGSGKSSVIMAGLLPALQDDAIPGSRRWTILAPFTPSGSPVERLADVFARELPQKTISVIRDELDHPTAQGVTRLARQVIDLDPSRRLVIYVDQFEELFTLTRSADEREQFIHLLTTAANDPDSPVSILISMRADFYDHALESPALAPLVTQYQIGVTRMSLAELYEAVRAPANAVGIDFEDGLVSDIVFAVRDEPGMLPLLQFTLSKLYELRTGGKLTRAAYQDLGEVLGALAQHADTTFAALPSEEHRRRARDLFLKLITPGKTAQESARRRAKISELALVDPAQRAIINEVKEAFVKARLLITDRVGDEETVEVSHEALLRRWDRLSEWVADARDDILFGAGLTADANDWARRGKPTDQPERIYQFSKLREAQDWTTRNLPDELIAAFLQASRDYEMEQERLVEARAHELQLLTDRQIQEAQRAESATIRARRANLVAAAVIALTLVFIVGAIVVTASQIASANEARLSADRAEAAAQAGARVAEAARVQADDSSTQAAIAADAAATRVAAANLQANRAASDADRSRLELSDAEAQISLARATVTAIGIEADAMGVRLDSESRLSSNLLVEIAASALDDSQNETAGLLSMLALNRLYLPEADALLVSALDQLQKPARVLDGHNDLVRALTFSPDGTQMLTGGQDNSARVRSLLVDRLIQQHDRTNYVNAAAYRPDGGAYLIGDGSGAIAQFDASTQVPICETVLPTVINAVVYNADGRYFASGDDSGGVRLWSADTCALLRIYPGHTSWVTAVAFTRDSRGLISAGADGLVSLWDTDTTAQIRTFTGHDDLVRAIAVSPDGTMLLTGSYDDSLRLWSIASGTPIRVFSGHSDDVYAVAFSPDGRLAASVALDSSLRLFEVVSGAPHSTHELPAYSRVVAFASDGRTIAVATSDTHDVSFWEVERSAVERIYPAFDVIAKTVAFTTDPRYAIFSGDNRVELWDVIANRRARVLAESVTPFNDAAANSDGTVIVTGSDDDLIRVWVHGPTAPAESPPPAPRVLRGHGGDVFSVALSPDGARIASGGEDFTARLWDTASGTPLHTLVWHYNWVDVVVFSPDGRYLATGDADGLIAVWESDSGALVRTFVAGSAGVKTLIYSHDGRLLLAGDDSGYVTVFDIAGEFVRASWVGADIIEEIALTPDDALLVVAFTTQPSVVIALEAILTDPTRAASEGGLARVLTASEIGARDVAIDPYGRYIASIAADGTARLWDVRYQDFIVYACERIGRDFTPAEIEAYQVPIRETLCSGASTPAVAAALPDAPDRASAPPPTPTMTAPVWTPLPTTTAYATPENPDAALVPPPTPIPSTVLDTPAVVGIQTGEIPEGGGHIWLFAGQAGQRVRIALNADRPARDLGFSSEDGEGLDTYIEVRSPDGTLLAASDDIERLRYTDSLIADLPLTETGEYGIEVRAWNDRSVGRYRLEISLLSVTPTPTASSTLPAAPVGTPIASPTASRTATASPTYPPTETLAPTPTFIPRGTAQIGSNRGTLRDGGKQAWQYAGRSGEMLTISVYAPWDTTLTVQQNSIEIGYNDDALPNNNSQLVITLERDRVYDLVVGSFSMVQNGDYELYIASSVATPDPAWTLTPGPIITQTPTASLTPPPTGTPFVSDLGAAQIGSNRALLIERTTHRFYYDGLAGETITVSLDTEWDTTLTLLDSGGSELAFNDDIEGSLNSQITYTLPTTGRVLLLVRGYADGVGGLYVMTLISDRP